MRHYEHSSEDEKYLGLICSKTCKYVASFHLPEVSSTFLHAAMKL